MSLILDALKKSEQDRKSGKDNRAIPNAPQAAPSPDFSAGAQHGKKKWPLILVIGLILGAGGYWLNRGEAPEPPAKSVVQQAPKPAPEKPAPPAPSPAPETPPVTTSKPAALPTAEAYDERGWEAISKGLYNQAGSDFDQALKMEPGFVHARFGRAWTHEKQGRYDEALFDYEKVMEQAPDHADAAIGHGVLLIYQGIYANAAQDFDRAFNVASDDLRPYAFLWLATAAARAGTLDRTDLEKKAAELNLTPWPGVLARHLLGRVDINTLMKEAEDGERDARRQKLVVAHYFLGEQALAEGNLASAQDHFEKALMTGMTDYRQYDAAREGLKKIIR